MQNASQTADPTVPSSLCWMAIAISISGLTLNPALLCGQPGYQTKTRSQQLSLVHSDSAGCDIGSHTSCNHVLPSIAGWTCTFLRRRAGLAECYLLRNRCKDSLVCLLASSRTASCWVLRWMGLSGLGCSVLGQGRIMSPVAAVGFPSPAVDSQRFGFSTAPGRQHPFPVFLFGELAFCWSWQKDRVARVSEGFSLCRFSFMQFGTKGCDQLEQQCQHIVFTAHTPPSILADQSEWM